ncbi:MAG: AAA family ATPase, partial [Terriglobales bacterium]
MQRRADSTSRTLVVGKQGSGKTTLAKLSSWGERVAIFNPNAISGWSCPRSWRADEIRRRLHTLGGFRFTIVPESAESWPGVVETACAEIFSLAQPMLVIWDEMDSFWPARQPSASISNLVQFGRNRGISWLGTTRRPAEIHRSVTAALTH